ASNRRHVELARIADGELVGVGVHGSGRGGEDRERPAEEERAERPGQRAPALAGVHGLRVGWRGLVAVDALQPDADERAALQRGRELVRHPEADLRGDEAAADARVEDLVVLVLARVLKLPADE